MGNEKTEKKETNMKHLVSAAVVGGLLISNGFASSYEPRSAVDLNGRTYQYVTNDPFFSRQYKLKNGLSVFLCKNDKEARIQSYIAVRAGSGDEKPESTGLAHYFEHMMFKGNSKIASLNWTKEKPLLDRLTELFELHRRENNAEKRAEIYHEIDQVSLKASEYSNSEYWDIVGTIGASGTNAWTSYDETVYVNDIPANQLERFLEVESVRFSDIALRRFHTELETVYEEFNRSQDSDFRMAYQSMMHCLFREHPYGRSVLGKPEHLKAPSMLDIQEFFHKYYVPENIALILSGKLEYEETMDLIEKTFGRLKT